MYFRPYSPVWCPDYTGFLNKGGKLRGKNFVQTCDIKYFILDRTAYICFLSYAKLNFLKTHGNNHDVLERSAHVSKLRFKTMIVHLSKSIQRKPQ